MKSKEDTTVPSHFHARRKDQILRTVANCGNSSGGDSNDVELPRAMPRGRGETASLIVAIVTRQSCFLVFQAVAASREAGCGQHECELGIADISQRPAIFSQHSRCCVVISAAGVRHADIGSANTVIDKAIETNCDTLRNISILLRPANFMRHLR
jgi:hypothetical protein